MRKRDLKQWHTKQAEREEKEARGIRKAVASAKANPRTKRGEIFKNGEIKQAENRAKNLEARARRNRAAAKKPSKSSWWR